MHLAVCNSSLQPFLVGKAVVPLRKWLTSSSLVCQCQLEVKTSSITDAVSGVSGDDPTFGTLSVRLFICGSLCVHIVACVLVNVCMFLLP